MIFLLEKFPDTFLKIVNLGQVQLSALDFIIEEFCKKLQFWNIANVMYWKWLSELDFYRMWHVKLHCWNTNIVTHVLAVWYIIYYA